MARFPKINLDITYRCTLQCQRCNRAIFAARGQKVPGEDMTMENFKKVIDYFEEVYFCGQISDPIFHPQFIEFLKLLKVERPLFTALHINQKNGTKKLLRQIQAHTGHLVLMAYRKIVISIE